MPLSYPPLEFLFEDDAIVALVKPAGLPTANAETGQESVYTLLRRRWPPGAFIGIVSRLDAATSGIVVIAKTPPAAAGLAAQFRQRTAGKTYLGVVEGRFPAPLEAWVDWHDIVSRQPGQLRSTIQRQAIPHATPPSADAIEAAAADDSAPKPAHTRARVRQRAGEVSLVELRPSTGRRHQLRVQLASRGCPIVGDRLYGSRLPFPTGIALHAAALSIEHPATGGTLRFEAPPDSDWTRRFPALALDRLGGR